MKKLLSLAAVAVITAALSGCTSCGDVPGCGNDGMLPRLGLFDKHSNKSCEPCAAVSTGCNTCGGGDSIYTGAAMLEGTISGSNCNCNHGGTVISSGMPSTGAPIYLGESTMNGNPTPAPMGSGLGRSGPSPD